MSGTPGSNFYEDVIKKDPRFNSTARVDDVSLLHPTMAAAVKNIIAEAQAQGITFRVFETYRSQTRQTELYNQKATQLKVVGTHHFGCACDLVKWISGEWSWKGSFDILGTLAAKHGLVWGGPGKNNLDIADLDHLQLVNMEDQPYLLAGDFYPDDSYRPY